MSKIAESVEEFLTPIVEKLGYEIVEVEFAKKYNGVAVPAHIDRSSYSVLSNLGFIPPELDITAVEITPKNRITMEKDYKNYKILSNSDAHYLEDISEPQFMIDIMTKSAKSVIEYLCKMS